MFISVKLHKFYPSKIRNVRKSINSRTICRNITKNSLNILLIFGGLSGIIYVYIDILRCYLILERLAQGAFLAGFVFSVQENG